MTPAPPTTGYLDPRPRWRRLVLRASAGSMTLLVILYLTLPWWLPTGWIGRRLCNQLTDGLGRPAAIGGVTLSWSEGITFTDLTIESAPGQPFPDFVRVRKLRCGFTPLTTLWTGRVNRIELFEPSLWLHFDDQGKITNLRRMGESEKLPTFKFVLVNPACHLITPDANQVFALEKLTCRIMPDEGVVTVDGMAGSPENDGESTSRHFEIHAQVNVPQLRKDIPFHGDVQIAWKNLAMTELPAPFVRELPFEHMDGTTTGNLHIQIPASLQLAYDLEVSLHSVSIAFRHDEQPGRIPDARLTCQGRFDPATEELIVRNFEFESPGLRVARPRGAPGPTMLIDQIGIEPFALHLEGQIKDFDVARREFPVMAAALAERGIDLQGTAVFAFSIQPAGTDDRITFRIHGQESSWQVAAGDQSILTADRGIPKSFEFELMRVRHSPQIALRRLRIRVGDMRAELRSEAYWDTGKLQRRDLQALWTQMTNAEASLTVHIDELSHIHRVSPLLGQAIHAEDWQGPLSMQFNLDEIPGSVGREAAASLTIAVDAGPETTLNLHDFWVKPQGVPMHIHLNTTWPNARPDRLHTFDFSFTQGDFAAVLLSEEAPVAWNLNRSRLPEEDAVSVRGRVEWILPGHIRHIEHARSWSPMLRQALDRAEARGTITGDLSFTCHGHAAAQDTSRTFWQRIRVVADQLAIQADDLVSKPRGRPMTLAAEVYRLDTADGEEFSVDAILEHPAVHATGRFTRSTPAAPVSDTQFAAVDLDVQDADALIEFLPVARRLVADYEPQGRARLALTTLTSDRHHDVHLFLNARQAAWSIPGDYPFVKPQGMAAEADLRWSITEPASDRYLFRLSQGRLELDNSRIDHLTGEFSIPRAPVSPATEITRAGASSLLLDADALDWKQSTGHLDLVATAALTDDFGSLNPDLRRHLRRLNLSGTSVTRLHLQFDPRELSLSWEADADQLSWDIPLQMRWLEREHKRAGVPMRLEGTLSSTGWRDGFQTFAFEGVELDMRGGRFRGSGQWTLEESDSDSVVLHAADLAFALDLHDLEQWMTHHPDFVHHASGALQAEGRLRWEGGRWQVDAGSLVCRDLSLTRDQNSLTLDGSASWAQQRLQVQQLGWQWGASSGVLSADLQRLPENRRPGYLGMAIRHLDVPDAMRQWQRLQSEFFTDPASDSAAMEAEERRVEGRPPWVMPFLNYVRDHDFHGDIHIGTLDIELPPDIPATVDAAAINVKLRDGHGDLTFSAIAEGGDVKGQLVTDLTVDDPQFHLVYTAERLEPGTLVDTYLQHTFPGMTARGPLTIIDETYQKLFPRHDEANPEVGEGELIIEGGVVEGRAVPEWMTRIFPNLNLSRYTFDYMHSWFDKMPSGRVRHRMIYQGTFYNLYMDGHVDPDHRMRYQVGIDLLADFDSRYWVETGQGRIPLFIKTGTIRHDGTLDDERITYQPARNILNAIFISNNPVITAYHAVRKQALRKD